jgi:limonene 1,2-monooxygenase
MNRMRFGAFIAPHHPIGEHPTLQFERDLELIEQLDRLGYDEVWVGEHHSGGWETIGHPELFLAAAAQRTHRIKLATGVTSLPYHHPYNVAGRIALLDHLSRGRAILGTGPGALPSDARTFGIDPVELRERQDQALEAVMPLLRGREPVTVKTDWYELKDGILQVRPVQEELEVVAAVSISPSGMRLAGKYGLGVISVASYSEEGLAALPTQWGWAETYASEYGTSVSRDNWRVMMPFHLAEDRQTAFEDIYNGLAHWHNGYVVGTLGRPGAEHVDDPKGFAHKMAERGGAIIGTPDDAVEAIARLTEISGGFGALVGFVHDWANQDAMRRSYDLFARYVIPRVQGLLAPVQASAEKLQANNRDLMERSSQGILNAIREHNRTHPRPT